MNYKQLIDKWNAEADLYNQWDCLSEEEKVEFALVTAATAAAKSAIPTEQVKAWDSEARATAAAIPTVKDSLLVQQRVSAACGASPAPTGCASNVTTE